MHLNLSNQQITKINRLKNHFEIIEFKKEQFIFYKGHLPYGLFILVSGKVVNLKKDKKKSEVINPFSCLGATSFLNYSPYYSTIKAIEDSKTLFISNNNYNKMLEKNTKTIVDFRKYISNQQEVQL